MSKKSKERLELRVAELEGVVGKIEWNNACLKKEICQLRHSIPLSVWRQRLRFIYPTLSPERIEELVEEEAEEREMWRLDKLAMSKKDLLKARDE